MREKLLLLSRFPVSPPNPRVSGGLPLPCGGLLHRHGGLPLPRGGFCSSSSPVTKCSLLSQIQTLFETHLHHTLKPPLPPSFHQSPPISPKHQIMTGFPLCRSIPLPGLFTQTLRAATKPLFTAMSPTTHVLLASDFLFPSRSLPFAEALRHPPSIIFLPAPMRPPPKPPPSQRVSTLVSLPSPKSPVVRSVIPPVQRLLPLRPPPKPPWLLRLSIAFLVWEVVYGVSMGLWIQVLGLCSSWLIYAHQVFDGIPHRALGCLSAWIWLLLWYMVIVKTFGDDTFANDYTNFQFALPSHAKWANLETISSRIERTQVKDIIRNWIGRKTAESLSLITTSTWELKRLLLWLYCCCVLVAYVLMDLEHSKCIGLNTHRSCVVVSFVVAAPRIWFGNVQPHLLHVIPLMLLVSFE